MNESFIHFIWKHRFFHEEQVMINHSKVKILHTGIHNSNAGPDFLNAKILVDSLIWAGNIEIHVKSSDWFLHKHHENAAYDNVILHIVKEFDTEIRNSKGRTIPTIELKYPLFYEENYRSLIFNDQWVSCSGLFSQYNEFELFQFLNRICIEKIERKSALIYKHLNHTKNDWEETLYRFIAKNFGFSKNNDPFEQLAVQTPLKTIKQNSDSLRKIEALLFGQAGFLNEPLQDQYHHDLKTSYEFLKNKHQLKPMECHVWKFSKMHPNGFPSIRIAQFADFLYHSAQMFSKVIEATELKQLQKMIECKASTFWDTHFHFKKESKKQQKKIGKTSINNILVNTILPFIFIYGKYKGNEKQKELAFDLLDKLPSEKNKLIEKWIKLSIVPKSAMESQALIYLKKEYCDKKKCLN